MRLIVCADDDVTTPGNPGLTKAREAAQAVDAWMVVPNFGEDRDPAWTDFNDLAVHLGPEVVAECIRRQTCSKNGVPGVTGAQPSPSAGSSRDTAERPGVTGVTEPTEDRTPEAEDGERVAKDPTPSLSDRPCFRVFDEWIEHPTGKLRPGVWFFGVKQGRKAEDPATFTQQWVCSPLYIDAVTLDGQSNNFGRLLRFKNTIGTWREWAMPMDLLRGVGDEMRGELLGMGVEIDPLSKSLLGQYLQSVHPKTRVHCALQVGWCGDSFVLPDEVVGPDASGVIFQSGDRQNGEYTCAGTLAGWQPEVAARAVGNPLLVQALSASFAGPMLKRCNAEGGGLHFTGDSNNGPSPRMAEGGRRAKAGQSVRLLDVSVSGKFGAWNNLHGFPTGAAFSDGLKRAAVTRGRQVRLYTIHPDKLEVPHGP